MPGVDVARDDHVADEPPAVGSKAPRQTDVGFAISPANIVGDHGAGIDARSISSIASTSSSASGRISTAALTPRPSRRARGRRPARRGRQGRSSRASARGGARAGDATALSSGGTSAPERLERGAIAHARRRRRRPCPARARARPRGAPRGSPSTSVKTSRRPASITGTAPGRPAASASSVETPATGRSSASASPRAAASRSAAPVKLPGPVPTTSGRDREVDAPASASNSRASRSTAARGERRSPRTPPSRTSATVATCVAVSKARIEPMSRGQSSPASSSGLVALERDWRPRRRHARASRAHEAAAAGPRPRSGHSTKTIASSKYGSRAAQSASDTAVEPVEVEVRDRWLHAVPVADRVRRARHRLRDTERAARAADERRLAAPELAGRPRRRRPAEAARPERAPMRLGLSGDCRRRL